MKWSQVRRKGSSIDSTRHIIHTRLVRMGGSSLSRQESPLQNGAICRRHKSSPIGREGRRHQPTPVPTIPLHQHICASRDRRLLEMPAARWGLLWRCRLIARRHPKQLKRRARARLVRLKRHHDIVAAVYVASWSPRQPWAANSINISLSVDISLSTSVSVCLSIGIRKSQCQS